MPYRSCAPYHSTLQKIYRKELSADFGQAHGQQIRPEFFRFKVFMAFFNSAVDVLQTLVIALGAGLGIWGVVNMLEGYGNDNPGAKSQGIKQLMAGAGVALIGILLVPELTDLFTITP